MSHTLRRPDFGTGASVAAANSLAIASGDAQSGVVGSSLPTPCVVLVLDQFGQPIAGVTVFWSITGDGSTGAVNDQSTTDASGLGATTVTLGSLVGVDVLTASVAGSIPGSVLFTLTATVGVASALTATAGDNQTANISTAVAIDPAVKVTDAFGNPKAGVSITWAIASGNGTVDTTGGTVTGVDGIATVTSWTLGSVAGTNTLTASSAGLTTVTFTANGQSTAATQVVVISGQTQTSVIAGANGANLVLEIRDVGGNPVQGFNVAVSLTSYPGIGGSAGWSASDANGRINVLPTTDRVVGVNIYTITATGLTGSPISLSVTTVAGPLAAVAFAVQPQSNVTTGITWTQQPSVKLTDQYGNTRLTDTSTVSLVVSAGNAVFAGTTSGAATAGVKTFSGLSFSSGSGVAQVRASAGGFTIDSNPIAVTAPIPHHLTISQEPSNVLIGQVISPAITVRVEASDNTLVSGSTALLTVTLASGTGNLGGTVAVNAIGGVATFSTLTVDAADNDFTLAFASAGLTGDTSISFTVSAPGAFHEPTDVTMTPRVVMDLTTETIGAPFGTIGDSHAGFTWFTGGNNVTVRSLSDPTWLDVGVLPIPSLPNGKDRVMACRLFAGGAGTIPANPGGEKGEGRWTIPAGQKTIYVRFDRSMTSNYWGHLSGEIKHGPYFLLPTDGGSKFYLGIKGASGAPTGVGYSHNFGDPPQGQTSTLIAPHARNTWANIEVQVAYETTATSADGNITIWVNDVEEAQVINIAWGKSGGGGGDVAATTHHWEHFFGGTSNATDPPDTNGAFYALTGDGAYISSSSSKAAAP